VCFKTPSKSSPGAPNHDQCCAQAPLIRQRSTSSQNPLLVGVGFAYIGPRHSTSKNPLLLLLLSAWGQIYRETSPPRHPPSKIPQSKGCDAYSSRRLVQKLTGRQNEKGRKKIIFFLEYSNLALRLLLSSFWKPFKIVKLTLLSHLVNSAVLATLALRPWPPSIYLTHRWR